MRSIDRAKPRRFDGRSLRYLGLLVGLCGLVYLSLNGDSRPRQATPSTAKTTSAATATEPVAQMGADVLESWLEALWSADELAVQRLLGQGISANGPLDQRNTRPLHLLFFGSACEFGRSSAGVLPVLERLIRAGASVNAADLKGNTPLMMAAAECGPEVVSRLLAAGADAGAVNVLGLSAFELTLTNASETGRVLAAHGFRLSRDQFTHYQSIYSDEPNVLKQLSLADPSQSSPR